MNIANMFIAVAQRWRERPAIESPEMNLTYEQFIQRAARTARHLRAHGVAEGDRVGVALASGPENIVSLVALWMLGAVAVPMDFRSRFHERQRQTRSLNLKFVVESRAPAEGSAYASITVDDGWNEALETCSAEPVFPPPGDHPAILSLTSGTSGTPQAMRIEHLTLYCRYSIFLLGGFCHPGARFLNPIPITFSSSRNKSLFHLLAGASVNFMPPLYSSGELAERICSTGANYTALVPTVLRELLDLAKEEKHILFPGLGRLQCGGASISADEKRLARERLCSNLLVSYGSGATSNISIQTGEEFDLFPESVGRPHDIVLLQIVDAENRPLPAGEIGAIRVRSPGNVTEILGARTEAEGGGDDRISNGWVYPGDIGSLNQEGYLTLHGRRSSMIIRGGANVYPAEIEAVLNAHPAIKESAVVGQPSRSLGEEIVAFVVTDGSVTQQELLAFCRSRFSADKRPRALFMMDSLPRNSSGKILYRELAATLEEAD